MRVGRTIVRSEEHTSELQSLRHLVCRLLLEKKKKKTQKPNNARLHTPYTPNTDAKPRRTPFGVARVASVVWTSLRVCLLLFLFFFFLMMGRPPRSPLFPYTPLFR